MNKEELWKHVDREVDWAKYYGYAEDIKVLDMDKPFYDQVRSIGYAKVNTPLDIRCNGYLCFEYKDGMKVEDLVSLNQRRNSEENKFTPLEVWVMLYPEDKEIINKRLKKIK
jgi:hypothetical protein